MAQAKTRASTKRSQTRKRSPATKKTQAARTKAKARPASQSSNGKSRVQAARHTVEHSTKEAGEAVSKVASKAKTPLRAAKTPLLAGGAAIAGAAGGLAIGAMRSHNSHSRKMLGLRAPHGKRVKVRSRDVAKAAKEVGTFGQHVGELATELRHVREESSSGNGSKHRSPVEVVLDGLTSRR